MPSAPTVIARQDLTGPFLGGPAWSSMASTGYTNAWSDQGGGNVTGQYRLWPLLNEMEIIGSISHASITGSSAFFTMPSSTLFLATAQLVCDGSSSSVLVTIAVAATRERAIR